MYQSAIKTVLIDHKRLLIAIKTLLLDLTTLGSSRAHGPGKFVIPTG
ncbi:MAG TPA: hypothetical protein VF765_09090 [Polyangiaceae bacterium]